MAKKRKLRQELSKFARKTEKPPEIISGALGIYIGGKQYVDIPTRPGYVFVRLRNNMSELIQAHNQTVSPIYDLPVLVVWNHNRYEIYGRDSEQYGSYWETSSSFLPKHGFQHEFDPDNNGGGDLVFVHGEQFYPMMTFPSGTDGANTVLIAPYRYFYQGLWRYTGNTGVGDLLALGPTGGNNAKLLLVGVTSATGNPFIKQGAEFSEGITGAAALTQFVPTSLTPIDEIPGAIIRLVTGTETITWANIYDARQYMGILQAGSGTGGGATDFLGLSDTPNSYSGQADKLLVVNSAENAVEFRTNTGTTPSLAFINLTDVPASYSGQGSKFVAVKSDTSGLEFVNSPGGGGGGSGLVIYDDSVYKVTGTAISFDSNLSVIVTGSIAYVSASGGSNLNNSNLTLTTSGTTSAAVNTRYFADIGGLVGDRYFVLPTGTTIGDQIELYLVTGSATYELIIKGDVGVSINGGVTATEWSRIFINQETLKFVISSITNWEISYDGRIPCKGRLERITTPFVTGTANVWTLPDWNNIGMDVGNIANLAQDRFDIRRAGYYLPSGNYAPGAAITGDNYCAASIWQNTTQVSTALNRPSVTSSLATVPLPTIPFYANLNDYFEFRFATQESNKGMGRTDDATTNPTKVGWVYFAIEEILRGA